MSAQQTFYGQCTNTEHRTSITNYCAAIECLKPLCPECIQEHFQLHQQNKIPAAIQSLTNTRINCEKKISKAIESLQKELEQYDKYYMFNPDEIVNQEINKMQEVKQQMFDIINLFFQEQENFLENKVKENQLKIKNIGGIFLKIQSVIEQLDQLKNNIIQNQDPLQFFQRACRLDVKSLLDRYKSDLKKIMKSRSLDLIQVNIDENKLFSLKNELKKIVRIFTNDNQDNDNLDNNSAISKKDQSILDQSMNQQINNNNNSNNNNNNNNNNFHQKQREGQQSQSHIGDEPPLPISLIQSEFQIVTKDYFTNNNKFLHFFINNTNQLKICNIELKKWYTIDTDYFTKEFHRSIAIPNGDIYISGGSSEGKKDSMIRKCNLQGKIQQVGQLQQPRSSHATVYCNDNIYFICGYVEQRKMTTSLEKFNIKQQKIEQCSPCNKVANSPACCSFNDRYIYKFGGNDEESGQIQLMIERYDTYTDKWELIDPIINEQDMNKFTAIYQCSACVQINKNNIYVFGGYDNEDKGVEKSFLLKLENNQHFIHQVDEKLLIYPEGFWNNQVITYNKKIYVLQNIEMQSDQIDEKNRALLCFDGHQWNELNYQILS